MRLELYLHPLSSFCQKAIMALYENETPFEPHIVDLGDPNSRAAFAKVWPLAKFPVLRDHDRDRTLPESSIIIEYVALHYPGSAELVPADPDRAIEMRLRDRFYDLYVNVPMQKIVTDRLRPSEASDGLGVEHARALLKTSYDVIDREMANRSWALGEVFSMADCAAAPALFYAEKVAPFAPSHPNVARYMERLRNRPSFTRVLEEARPYWPLFPDD